MTTAVEARAGRAAEHRFFAGMAWAVLAVVALGFARSYYLRPLFPDMHALTPPERFFYSIHGVLFTAWIVLLATQPALIAARRVALHRKLGWLGAGLAAGMVVTGVQGAILAARRPGGFMGIPVPASQFVVVPLTDMLLFATFVGFAIWKRQDAQAHKRLMLLGSINLTTAAIARMMLVVMPPNPIVFFALTDLFFVAMIAWDRVALRRLHPATLWGTVLTVASQPLRLAVSGTDAWAAFAAWLLG